MKHTFLLVLLLNTTLFALAQVANRDDYTLNIKITTEPIVIDGLLNETSWAEAQTADNFWLNAPSDNGVAGNTTTVKVTYDDKNIYIAAEMKGPTNFIIQSLKRDG
ncbi:MAG TPA: hydrolase, partial [Cyclobacteriaceae bacterium]